VLQRLVDGGNTVVVIEHNLDVIKSCDWLVDLGPEGGDAGGEIVFEGTPEDLTRCEGSHTGRFLKSILERDGPALEVLPAMSVAVPSMRPPRMAKKARAARAAR